MFFVCEQSIWFTSFSDQCDAYQNAEIELLPNNLVAGGGNAASSRGMVAIKRRSRAVNLVLKIGRIVGLVF